MDTTLEQFLEQWTEDEAGMRVFFGQVHDYLVKQTNVQLDFKARPGISYSLRAKHDNQKKRDLYVLVDVIDDEPEERWLSLCFYAESLPEELQEHGDIVPGGLMGEDACCFDVSENDEDFEAILFKCLDCAHKFASAE